MAGGISMNSNSVESVDVQEEKAMASSSSILPGAELEEKMGDLDLDSNITNTNTNADDTSDTKSSSITSTFIISPPASPPASPLQHHLHFHQQPLQQTQLRRSQLHRLRGHGHGHLLLLRLHRLRGHGHGHGHLLPLRLHRLQDQGQPHHLHQHYRHLHHLHQQYRHLHHLMQLQCHRQCQNQLHLHRCQIERNRIVALAMSDHNRQQLRQQRRSTAPSNPPPQDHGQLLHLMQLQCHRQFQHQLHLHRCQNERNRIVALAMSDHNRQQLLQQRRSTAPSNPPLHHANISMDSNSVESVENQFVPEEEMASSSILPAAELEEKMGDLSLDSNITNTNTNAGPLHEDNIHSHP